MRLSIFFAVPSLLLAQSNTRPPSQTSSAQQQPAYLLAQPSTGLRSSSYGSIPTGEPVPNLELSLRDALNRALKYNLAIVEGGENAALRRGERLQALSQLLPLVYIRPQISEQQINLAAFGLKFPGAPSVVGPFHLWDLRGYASEQFGLSGWRSYQAGKQNVKAAELSLRDARDQVVSVVVQLYLQCIAASARIDAARIQVDTAQALYTQALDRKNAGVIPGIDVLRSQVELQSQQQRSIYYEGEFEKQKLTLARAIGLPLGQEFRLTDTVPYQPMTAQGTLEDSLTIAYKTRADLQATEALVRSAELLVGAAKATRYPSAVLNGDYGANGLALDQLHGSFNLSAGMNLGLFEGGRRRAAIEENEAVLAQRRSTRDNLRGQIDNDVRTAFVDLRSSSRQVEVAGSNLDLARQEVEQARDRFAAGVVNNVEVVQAQEALALANENYIASLYAFNSAKAALSRARGDAEESILRFLSIQ